MTLEIKKEEHLYRIEEKLNWFGHGEWVEEPDAVEFDYEGYEAVIHRVCKKEPFTAEEHYFGGHLCGYVKIPKEHPLFGKDWGALNEALDCHGGITCNEYHEEHWIGFDCAHSGDLIPSMVKLKAKFRNEIFPIPKEFSKHSIFNETYRNVEYVINDCKSLIDQLIKITAAVK